MLCPCDIAAVLTSSILVLCAGLLQHQLFRIAFPDAESERRLAICITQALIMMLSGKCPSQSIMSALQAWRTYNTSALDFNIFYCARNSRALADVIAPEEASAINVTWEAPRDDLKQYFTTHMQYMRVSPAVCVDGLD